MLFSVFSRIEKDLSLSLSYIVIFFVCQFDFVIGSKKCIGHLEIWEHNSKENEPSSVRNKIGISLAFNKIFFGILFYEIDLLSAKGSILRYRNRSIWRKSISFACNWRNFKNQWSQITEKGVKRGEGIIL